MVREGRLHVYLDSSVVLRRLFRQPGGIPLWDHWDTACSSELLRVEVLRAIDRLQVEGAVGSQAAADHRGVFLHWLEHMDLLQLDLPILLRAGDPFPVWLGTLDALHLASALAWKEQYGEPLELWTHDRQLALAARSMGLAVEGV